MSKLSVGVVALGAMLGSVAVASADAFGTSTAITSVTTLQNDVAVIIGGVVVGILSLLAALMGLGWGVKKFRHYITGKKF